MSDVKKSLREALDDTKNSDVPLEFESDSQYRDFIEGLSSFGEQFKQKVNSDLTAGTTTSRTVSYPEGTDPYDSD